MKTFLRIVTAVLLAQVALISPASAQQRAVYPGWQNSTGGATLYSAQYSSTCPDLYSNLQYGMTDYSSSGQVTQLQQFLASHYRVDPVRLVIGIFGPLTKQYVTQFQRERGLSPVGIVGPYTRIEIKKVCAPPPATVPIFPAALPPSSYQTPYYQGSYYQEPVSQTPALYDIAPRSGPPGTAITITGTDFTSNNTIHFGPIAAGQAYTYSYGTILAMIYTVPPNTAPGAYAVYVSNENGRTGSIPFEVTAP